MRLKFLLKIAQLVSDGWNLNPVLCNSRICPCLLTRETNLRWVLVNHYFSKLETWTCGVLRKYMGLTLINIESYIEKVAPFSVFFSLHWDEIISLVLVCLQFCSVQFSVWLFATQLTASRQASLSITNSRSPPKPMPIVSVMPSNHLIVCHPLLLWPSVFPSIRVFSNESALRIRWPKYWSFSFNSSPSNEHPGLISFRMDWSPLGWTGWISLQFKGLSRVFSNTTVQKHQFFGAQLSLQSNSHIHTWLLEKP